MTAVGYGDESDFGLAPIPPGAPVEGGCDRHVLVRPAAARAASCSSSTAPTTSAGRGNAGRPTRPRTSDLGSAALRHEGWTSADAAGLPILAGPGPLRRGRLGRGRPRDPRHLRRRPAAPTSTPPPTTPRAAARDPCRPMGLRLRLRRGYYERPPHRLPARQPVAADLRGALPLRHDRRRQRLQLVLHRRPDAAWDDDDLNRLKDVPGSAFVVVDLGGAGHDALLTRPAAGRSPAAAR